MAAPIASVNKTLAHTDPPTHASKTDSSLEIRVMGELAVFCNGEQLSLPRSRKTRALLAYLAVTNQPQSRERICEMFWDVPDDPRGSLRWSLSKIRQILNGDGTNPVITNRNTVSLRVQSIELDLRSVKVVSHRELASLAVVDLENLVKLFRGEFLEDLSLPRCPKYEAWRVSWISELNLLKARLLRALIDRFDEDASRALHYAHALRAMHPEDASLSALVQNISERAWKQEMKSQSSAPRLGNGSGSDRSAIAAGSNLPSSPDIRYCTADDGARIAYSVVGKGLPIVRAAAWMSHLQLDRDSPIWRRWTDDLSAQNQFVRYDDRGHGLSDRKAENLSFETLVADLEHVVEAARLERFALLGISHGCAVSIAYAVRHPDRVSHLVLCGGYSRGWQIRAEPDGVALHSAISTLIRRGWGSDNSAFRHLFAALFVPGATQQQLDTLIDHQRMTASPACAARLYEAVGNIDISSILSQVRAPTLVFHARNDQAVPRECGRAIADGISGARFTTLETSNHILIEEEPALIRAIDELRAFVNTDSMAKQANGVDRSQVAVLAINIVNPLHAFASMDQELVLRQVDPLLETTFEIIEQAGGVIGMSAEAGIIVIFDSNNTKQNHVVLACHAALAIKSRLEIQSEGTVRVSIGLDAGEIMIRRRRRVATSQAEVNGVTVRIAARLARSLRRAVVAVTGRVVAEAGKSIEAIPLTQSDLTKFERDKPIYELRRVIS
jgi:pimeloyl-ACP methyl ester carboxylesterase/DNA-binding SARP family transcriptional activator